MTQLDSSRAESSLELAAPANACKICSGSTEPAGRVHGRFSKRSFELRRCPRCAFAFVAEPWTDYEAIYDDDYYEGRGADPLVNYVREVAEPDSIRRYEWRGILDWARSLTAVDAETAWLDYGCGIGGLVAYLRTQGLSKAVGLEPGAGAARWRAAAPEQFVDPEDLEALRGRFDIVSAVEVIEHVVDPIRELERMRTLLRPGGLLLLTTGNAAPYRERLHRWRYVVPEVHVSFFEPRTLALALEKAGFEASFPGRAPGWEDIIRFKVLKNLRLTRANALESRLPWRQLTALVDSRLGLSCQPIGWADPRSPFAQVE